MKKQELYPKTERLVCDGAKIQITEKLDGSNLIIFKYNDILHIAQRNNIFEVSELEEKKEMLYKGLKAWIDEHKDKLQEELNECSAICGEWLGMGKLKYPVDEFDKRFYMFAKANIEPVGNLFKLTNLKYDHSLFIYPFVSQTIPSFIGVVPVIAELKNLPNKEQMDKLYMKKSLEKSYRNIEGFVINYENKVTKYVRMKNGRMSEHFDRR